MQHSELTAIGIVDPQSLLDHSVKRLQNVGYTSEQITALTEHFYALIQAGYNNVLSVVARNDMAPKPIFSKMPNKKPAEIKPELPRSTAIPSENPPDAEGVTINVEPNQVKVLLAEVIPKQLPVVQKTPIQMEQKTCLVCGKTKPVNEYRRNRCYNKIDGYQPFCNNCAKLADSRVVHGKLKISPDDYKPVLKYLLTQEMPVGMPRRFDHKNTWTTHKIVEKTGFNAVRAQGLLLAMRKLGYLGRTYDARVQAYVFWIKPESLSELHPGVSDHSNAPNKHAVTC